MKRQPHSRAGFTLVELMIAMIAGGFAIAGVYYLNGVSTRAMSQQMQVADTQMALRSAMEQVRRDFARAGYLGSKSTRFTPDCDGSNNISGTGTISPRWIRALNVIFNGSITGATADSTVVKLLSATSTRADDVTLWGNYATSDAYLGDPTRSTSSAIYLQGDSEAFRRSFWTPALGSTAEAFNSTLFADTFKAGRMLRIEAGGRFFFRDISNTTGTTAANPVINLATALPACVETTGWMAVAPVMQIHYALENDQKPEFSRLRNKYNAIGSQRPLLVRREQSMTNSANVDGTTRVVLDYAVELGVDAVVNTVTDPTQRPAWDFRLNSAVGTASSSLPERFRSLIVTLSARGLEADTRLPAMTRSPFNQSAAFNGPLMTFNVWDPNNTAITSVARVRTLRTEIFLQNL